MTAAQPATVRRTPDRFEILLDGQTVGRTEFVDDGDRRVFVHTEVDPQHGGKGFAGRLVGEALDVTRAEGLRIVPLCGYVRRFAQRSGEYVQALSPVTDADRDLLAD